MKVYTFVDSLNTIKLLINELLRTKPELTLEEAQDIIWKAVDGPILNKYDAIYYEENRVICVVENENPAESDWLAFPINWVSINPKRFYRKGEKQYQSTVNLNAYFKENLPPMPKVRIGVDVPSLDQIQMLKL